ncbi:ArgS-related anticodon-binding protein NrtL [Streptomyces sp. NPDC050703]|uniref:ArgS-related anticodon-binding protein NrtL n=1 Tax=Streptomyces sp. NPDC050703 TaxID=3157218 RepID=UPI00342AFB17
MTPVELSRTVLRAMRAAVDAGELRVPVPEDVGAVPVERPRPGGCGDYATSVALRLARAARMRPRDVADVLAPWLAAQPGIAGVDITGPGFLNVTLAGAPSEALVREIAEVGLRYGHAPRDTGQLAQIHVPREVRALVVADAVRRILRSQGTLVRVTCDAAPEAAWVDVLGIRVDAHGRPPADLVGPQPALASGDLDAPQPAPGAPSTPQPTPASSDLGASRPVPAPASGDLNAPQPAPGAPGAPQPTPASSNLGTPRPTPRAFATPRPVPASGDPLRLGRDAGRWALLHPAAHDHARVTPEQGGDRHLEQREGNPLFRVQYAHARCRALTRNAADLGFTSTPGDLGFTPTPADLGFTPAPGALGFTPPPGDFGLTPTPADLGLTPAPGALGFTPPPGDLGLTPTPADPGLTPAPGDLGLTPPPGGLGSTPPPGGLGSTPPPGGLGLTPTPADPQATPTPAAPRATPAHPLLTALADYPPVLAAAARHRAPDRLARQLVVVADGLLAYQHLVLPRGEEKPSAAHRARLALAEAAGTVLAGGLSLLGISAPEHV